MKAGSFSESPSNVRPPFDPLLEQIAEYVTAAALDSREAYETARYCLMDTLGCGLLALNYPACVKLLGPVVPGTVVPDGSRVLGTKYELDSVTAAFNIGALIRWLDFNDTWLAAEWAHPSDNLGGILAVADFVNRQGGPSVGCRVSSVEPPSTLDTRHSPFTVRDLLIAMIKAHEIQGVLALENSFNRVGLDHVLLVRVASSAVATQLLGGSRETHATMQEMVLRFDASLRKRGKRLRETSVEEVIALLHEARDS